MTGILRSAIARRETMVSEPERQLAGRLGGALYIAGAVFTGAILLGTDLVQRWPGLLAVVAVAGLLWGAASLLVIDWIRRPPLVLVAGTFVGLAMTAAGIWSTGGAHSPLRLQVLFVVVYAAYFLSVPLAVLAAVSAAAIACAPLLLVSGGGGTDAASHVIQAAVESLTLVSVAVVMILASAVLRRSRRDAELLALQQETLGSLATAVASEEPLSRTLELAARRTVALLEADGASVTRFEADERVSVMGVWTIGGAPSLAVGTSFALRPDGEHAQMRRHRKPVRVDAYGRDNESVVARLGYGSFVAVPVAVAGELWGTLSASTVRPGGLPPDAAERLTDIAEVVALAVAADTARRQLTEQALTDPLTGLANRRALHERLEEEVCRAARHARPVAMAVLDVDAFKATNDSAGHAAGDAALRSMAAALRAATRAGDVVGRLGGDEFAILFPEAGALDAMRAIERARATLAGPQPAGVPAVAFSAGICDLEQAVDAESLMRRADAALYLAKEHGRGLSWIYDHHVAAEISAEDRLASRRRTDALAGLQALARAIDAKDHGTREHSARVAELAAALARRLDWPQRRVELLHEAAVVHDVGKIGVPDAVLLKSGRLNPDEYEQVKHHAALGAQIIDGVLTPEQVGWVRGHHERCDGAGYPDGLRDADIPEGAAILAVADAFDAMTASRPYGVPLTVPEGLAECSRAAGTQFRPGIVAALLAMQADIAPAARDAVLR